MIKDYETDIIFSNVNNSENSEVDLSIEKYPENRIKLYNH